MMTGIWYFDDEIVYALVEVVREHGSLRTIAYERRRVGRLKSKFSKVLEKKAA